MYARAPWDRYCEQYGQGRPETLLWGMNPGPFGMAQTGVPFGEVSFVRDWLGLEAAVGRPPNEHPKRPIQGFSCSRSEVSGARLWGWAKDTYGTPEAFFARFFIANYCPLVFMSDSGANLTPDKLPAAERAPLFAACDRAMLRIIAHFQPRRVVGVGAFAEDRLSAVLLGRGLDIRIGRVPHPSPASPAANAGWAPLMTKALADLGALGGRCFSDRAGPSDAARGLGRVPRSGGSVLEARDRAPQGPDAAIEWHRLAPRREKNRGLLG